MNIAIYGGSFDPPHIAHEEIVYKSLKKLDIDKLIVLPTYINRFKNRFYFTPKQRLDLLKMLFLDDSRIEVCSFEVDREKPTATIKSIKYIKNRYKNIKNIYLIIGEDNLSSLHKWKRYKKLKKLVKFVVFSRKGFEKKDVNIKYKKIKLDIDISSTSLRKNLDKRYISKKILKRIKKYEKQNRKYSKSTRL